MLLIAELDPQLWHLLLSDSDTQLLTAHYKPVLGRGAVCGSTGTETEAELLYVLNIQTFHTNKATRKTKYATNSIREGFLKSTVDHPLFLISISPPPT